MKIKMIAVALLATMTLSAENTTKLRIWIGNQKAEYVWNEIDSLTFYTEVNEEPTLPEPAPAEGVGVFSVAEGKTVAFASGNLQYNAAQGTHYCIDGSVQQGTWRFAENQYDCIGGANKNSGADYDGWIDLFNWGTSGYDNTENDPGAIHYQPWERATGSVEASANEYGYGPSANMTDENLTGTSANYDWGVYNAVSDAGNRAGLWRTLSKNEWDYLLNTRADAQTLWSQATVNGVPGVIVLPDNCEIPASLTWTPKAGTWTVNTYSVEEWKLLENLGAVFLPAAGSCYGTNVSLVGVCGFYWSSTSGQSGTAFSLSFSAGDMYEVETYRNYGQSVRLVQDITE